MKTEFKVVLDKEDIKAIKRVKDILKTITKFNGGCLISVETLEDILKIENYDGSPEDGFLITKDPHNTFWKGIIGREDF